MAITKGVILGPYEILAHIGAGGMGEVWRARDKRIGRDVAVKVLPEFVAGNDQVRRFEQEARAAGALNHPGLVTIFDVGTFEESPYIVMELLEGETLRDALGDGTPAPPPLRKTIDYAIQISLALAVAHEKGIIHRDLKPENLFVTTDGRVKILDFGLAKLAEDATDRDGRSKTARHLTSSGMVVGTPGYMSPEQVSAKPFDYRTDIFSLGAVLYEMISGSRAFDRDTAVETMMAVLNEEPPPLNAPPSKVPPILESIVRHCMEKNPRERFQSARDLAFDLRMLPDASNQTTKTRQPPMARRHLPYVAVAVLALMGAGAGGWALLRNHGTKPAVPRTYRQLTFADGIEIFPTLAPDGTTFAYVSAQSGNRDIYVQRVDGRAAINITADSTADDSEPAFSPDGGQIAFRSEREGGGIYVMSANGESPRRVTDFGHNPSWSSDAARIVVATEPTEMKPRIHINNSQMWIVDTHTGAKRLLQNDGPPGSGIGTHGDALQPAWSPHGKRIAFWGMTFDTLRREIWTIDPDAPDPARTVVRAASSNGGAHWNPVWSADGRYLYFGGDNDGTLNLWRIPIDEETGTPAGPEEPALLPAVISGHYSFSKQGEMVYTTMTRSYFVLAMPFDEQSGALGLPQVLFGGSEEILCLAPSPDRRTIAFTTGGQEHLFLIDANGKHLRQLTNDSGKDRSPVWSPDGKTLYWFAKRSGGPNVWSIKTDGSSFTRVTDDRDSRRAGVQHVYMPDVSPDGKTLAVETDPVSSGLVHLDRPAGQRLEIVARDMGRPQWSPDGRSLLGFPALNKEGIYLPGVAVHSLDTQRTIKVLDRGVPYWLPRGHRIAFFENQQSGVLDLDTGRITTHPFTSPPGVELEQRFGGPVLSADGSTFYVRQTVEHSDIWIVHP
jgi:Tol biopolymer transport system component